MKKIVISVIVVSLTLFACKQEKKVDPFQGEWRKEGFVKKAFTVIGDSIIYPGLPNRYLYELKNDTLTIHFTNTSTKSPVISLTTTQMLIFDAAVTKDTIRLEKINPSVPTE